ncbi:MAG: hypothetical protein AAGJ08_10885 [Cyanobacteria bacterium P01_H01_bin.35]
MKSGVRSQESGVRSQESGVRSRDLQHGLNLRRARISLLKWRLLLQY